MVDKKEKQYITENAHLMDEWNWKRNADTTPFQYTLSSHNKVWWVCIKGHEWQASIAHRNNGRGCPYCSGKKVLSGYNDLQTINPKLATEWNYEKNGDFRPDSITSNSGKKAWWRCSEGHEWQATIDSRSRGHGCPYCSGRFAIKGKNDLHTVNPTLVAEWNFEKNGNLKPGNIKANSQKKVWWKCRKGHEWQASISHRNKGRGCPVCNSESKNSFPEYALRYYLEQNGLQVIQAYREKGYELDIFIPSKAVGIEYDGYFWHKNKEAQDLAKNSKCKNDGIKLYRIREGLLPLNDTSIDYVVERYQGDLGIRLKEVLSEIVGHPVDVNLDRDFIAIENLRHRIRKGNSLLTSNPELEIEWDYEKNGNLKPENIAPNSSKKVWWKCCEGHEWQAIIYLEPVELNGFTVVIYAVFVVKLMNHFSPYGTGLNAQFGITIQYGGTFPAVKLVSRAFPVCYLPNLTAVQRIGMPQIPG